MIGFEYSINISQKSAHDCDLPESIDLIDLAIIDMLSTFSTLKICKKMSGKPDIIELVDGEIFYWFDWTLIRDRLPRARIKSRSAAKARFKKLIDAGMLLPHAGNKNKNACWYAFGDTYHAYRNVKSNVKSIKSSQKPKKDVRQTDHLMSGKPIMKDERCPANRSSDVRQTDHLMSGKPDVLKIKQINTDLIKLLKDQIDQILIDDLTDDREAVESPEQLRAAFLAHCTKINFEFRHQNGLNKYFAKWLAIRKSETDYQPNLAGEEKQIFENASGYAEYKLARPLKVAEKKKLAHRVRKGLTGIQLYHLFLPTTLAPLAPNQINLNFLLSPTFFDAKRFPKTTESGSKFVKWSGQPQKPAIQC